VLAVRGSTIVLLFVAMYFGAATVAFIRTGIIADVFRGPPGGYLRGVPASGWAGVWWLPGKVISILFLILVAWNLALMLVAFVILSSPLMVLRFVNDLSGRPPPQGALAKWYEGVAQRWMNRGRGCRLR